MRRSSLVLGALASLLAPAAGVLGYQSWAPGPARAVDSPVATSAPSGHAATPEFRYRPCQQGAKLVGGACVIHRVRVVVAPPAAGAPAPGPGAVPSADAAVPHIDASPGHAHPSPTHEVDPVEEPTPGPVVQPSSPSTPPDCAEPQDDQAEEEDEGDDGDDGGRESSDDCGWGQDHEDDAGEDSDGASGEEG